MAALEREVARIIACPYPPSLAKLAALLAVADPRAVRASISDRPPCAISKLAAVVNDALPLWHNAVAILQALSHLADFREKLLLHNPALLDALLNRANASQHDFEQYADLCVTLLSGPLPDSIPLPSSAQTFFLRVFEAAIRAPDVGTLKPVYCMLNGACKGFLNILSSQTRHSFDTELCRILSSNGAGRNSMLMLWCIGIVILAEHPEAIQRPRRSDTTFTSQPPLEWKTASGRKIFGSESCKKTVNLTYLNVIWAAKGDVGISDGEALEGIRIATRTLQCIDRQVYEAWPKSSSLAAGTFSKLPAKILRSSINPAVQLEALSFYALVAGKDGLPLKLVTEYEAALIATLSLADTDALTGCLSISLPLFAPQMQEASVLNILSKTFSTCTSARLTHEILNTQALVDRLAAVIAHCSRFRSKVLCALSSHELQGPLQRILEQDAMGSEGGNGQSCCSYAEMTHRALVSSIVSMLLASILTTEAVPSPSLRALGTALIERQHSLLIASTSHCSHAASTSKFPAVSLFQQECTPSTGVHMQDWRIRLQAELENQDFYQRDCIMRSVAQICHDLEARCETVEEPLRKEQEKSTRLEGEIAELRQKLASLEEKRFDDREVIDGLDADNGRLQVEKDQYAAQLKQLRLDLEAANTEADATLRAAREAYDANEARLRSTVFAHEEDLRARETKIQRLVETTTTLSDKLAKQDEERRALGEQHNKLKVRFEESERGLQNEQQTVVTQVQELTRLNAESGDLQSRLHDIQCELDGAMKRIDELQMRNQELAQSSNEALQKLKEQHHNEAIEAATKTAQELNQAKSALQDIRQQCEEITEAHCHAQRDVQHLRAIIPPLRTRVQELTDECSEKEHELSELRSFRSRILASVTVPFESAHARSAPQAGNATGDPRTPRQHRRRKSAIRVQERLIQISGGSGETAPPAMDNFGNIPPASSDPHSPQSGSTPKPPKPQSSFKVPAMHTPFGNKPVLLSKPISKRFSSSRRAALRPVSPNRRHTTAGLPISEAEEGWDPKTDLALRKRSSSSRCDEQGDSDMYDCQSIGSLTPGNFLSGTGKFPDEEGGTTEL